MRSSISPWARWNHLEQVEQAARPARHSVRARRGIVHLGIERDISSTGFLHPNENWGHYAVVPSRVRDLESRNRRNDRTTPNHGQSTSKSAALTGRAGIPTAAATATFLPAASSPRYLLRSN
jgi:hypothetical protein